MRPWLYILAILASGCFLKKDPVRFESSEMQTVSQASPDIDSGIYAIIKPYSDSLAGTMDKVIAISQKELTNKRPEGILGNFITDLILDYVRSTILPKEALCVVLNGGGFRAPLPKGEITVGRVFETLPFDNQLVVLKLSREQADRMISQILWKRGEPVSNLLIRKKGKEVSWELKNKGADDQYIYVATSDYLADGNDGYDFFKRAVERYETGMMLRDVIILELQNYTRLNQRIEPEIEGRIIIE